MEKLNDMPYIPDLKGMGFTAPTDNESYKPNLRFKFDVDIAWYIGQIALFIGGVMGIVGFMFAAVLG